MSYSARYARALAIAARAHHGQVRKGTDVPYLTHPVHVARILDRYGFSEDLVLAGLLHDVLEDTDVPEAELLRELGAEVTALVRAVTETKQEGGAERPWEVRKDEQLEHLSRASDDALALKAADALHNATETLRDVREHGAATAFARFKRGPAPSIGYYRRIAHLCTERLDGHAIARELAAVVDDLDRAARDPV